MNYKLIMLPQPILVSDEEIEEGDWFYHPKGIVFHATPTYMKGPVSSGIMKKIIAGLPELPKLDLSLIADGIELVDAYKLAYKYIQDEWSKDDDTLQFGIKVGFRQGFETAQSLNEKKYSEEDLKYAMFQVFKNGCRSPKEGCEGFGEIYNRVIQSLSKPKEYQVEVEMQTLYFDGTRWVDSLPKKFIDKLVKTKVSPKITNNTIKILRTI